MAAVDGPLQTLDAVAEGATLETYRVGRPPPNHDSQLDELSVFRVKSFYGDDNTLPWPRDSAEMLLAAVQSLSGRLAAHALNAMGKTPRDVGCSNWMGDGPLAGWESLPLDYPLTSGVGVATLWRDVQAMAPGRMPDPQAALQPWLEVAETWLSIGGVTVVLGPKGERLDLCLSGPGFDTGSWA